MMHNQQQQQQQLQQGAQFQPPQQLQPQQMAGNNNNHSNHDNSNNGDSQQQQQQHVLKRELYKTEMCKSFEQHGTCRYAEKCQFAHGVEQLRVTRRHPKYKSRRCRNFAVNGTCTYGKRCMFLHERGPPPGSDGVVANNRPMAEEKMSLSRPQHVQGPVHGRQLQPHTRPQHQQQPPQQQLQPHLQPQLLLQQQQPIQQQPQWRSDLITPATYVGVPAPAPLLSAGTGNLQQVSWYSMQPLQHQIQPQQQELVAPPQLQTHAAPQPRQPQPNIFAQLGPISQPSPQEQLHQQEPQQQLQQLDPPTANGHARAQSYGPQTSNSFVLPHLHQHHFSLQPSGQGTTESSSSAAPHGPASTATSELTRPASAEANLSSLSPSMPMPIRSSESNLQHARSHPHPSQNGLHFAPADAHDLETMGRWRPSRSSFDQHLPDSTQSVIQDLLSTSPPSPHSEVLIGADET